MSSGGSNSSILRIMRGFAACLHLCQLMWTAVTLGATKGVGLAEKSPATKRRTTFLTACTALAMSIACCLQASAVTRHVVLLFDERVELPGLSLLDKELANTLWANSPEPVEIYREAMDLSRFSSSSYKTRYETSFVQNTRTKRLTWQSPSWPLRSISCRLMVT